MTENADLTLSPADINKNLAEAKYALLDHIISTVGFEPVDLGSEKIEELCKVLRRSQPEIRLYCGVNIAGLDKNQVLLNHLLKLAGLRLYYDKSSSKMTNGEAVNVYRIDTYFAVMNLSDIDTQLREWLDQDMSKHPLI